MNQRHRIFIAINLPNDIKKRLADFEQKYADVPAKWTAKDNLHISVLFLGDITDEELAKVCQVVKEVTLRHDVFNIALHKVAYGPQGKISPRPPKFLAKKQDEFTQSEEVVINDESENQSQKLWRPRYIWAGGEKVEEMVALKKDLEDSLFESVKFNMDPPARAGKNIFIPHITLARINEWAWRTIEPEERPEVGEDIELTFTVESIEVMESELTRQGPRYTIIESRSLQ